MHYIVIFNAISKSNLCITSISFKFAKNFTNVLKAKPQVSCSIIKCNKTPSMKQQVQLKNNKKKIIIQILHRYRTNDKKVKK